MKSFFQFLNEAQSQASMQAKKLNLSSDGHGGWVDSRGKFVAVTEKGRLKFVDKKPKKSDDESSKQQKTSAWFFEIMGPFWVRRGKRTKYMILGSTLGLLGSLGPLWVQKDKYGQMWSNMVKKVQKG